MNNKEEHINHEVQAALDSLEGIQRATPGNFFFTRVQARLTNTEKGSWEMLSHLIARPAVAFSGLCMVILINTMAVYLQSERVAAVDESTELAQVNEYAVGTASFYNYENAELK